MAAGNKTQIVRFIFFWILLAALFVAYLYGVTELMGLVNGEQENWYQAFFSVCHATAGCTFGTVQTGMICSICDSIASMLVTMIPSVLNAMLMTFLPMFIGWFVPLLSKPSISQNTDIQYNILFVFLILIMGIVQVAFPNMVDMTTG